MTETYVHLHGCVTDTSFNEEYLKKHLDEKKKRLKRIAVDLPKIPLKMSEEHRSELEAQQEEMIKGMAGKTMPDIYQVFKRFGKEDLYHLIYAHCSLWTHNDSHTFERYLDESPQGIKFVDYKDLNQDIILSLLLALKLAFLAYEDVSLALGKTPVHREAFATEYNRFHDEFVKLRDTKA